MRRGAALLLGVAMLLALCACGQTGQLTPTPSQSPQPSPAQMKAFYLSYDPNGSLHPITGDSQVNRALTTLVYEGLYRLDGAFQPQPVLAAGAQTDESGLMWTITVAEGISFSDGTPLTAAHAAASLNTARSSPLYAGRLSAVTSVTAEEGAVIITLSAPNGALPALLDIPVVLEGGEETPLGTGRYRYARDGDRLSLLANANHGGALPYESIGLCPVTGSDQRINSFNSGAVTAVTTDFTSAFALGYSGSCETWDYPTPELLFVGFRASGGPCGQAGVRRAFSVAFDRAELVAGLMAGHGDPTALPISPLHGDYDGGLEADLRGDLSAAADQLTQAGYVLAADGLRYSRRVPLTVTLLVNSDNSAKVAMAGALAGTLEELGVTVKLSALPWADYVKALAGGSFDLYLGEVRLTGDFDPGPLLSGDLNYGGYDAAPLAQALVAWRGSAAAERTEAAQAFWKAFGEETPFAPLGFKRESLLVRWDTVEGLSPTWGDPFLAMDGWTPLTE